MKNKIGAFFVKDEDVSKVDKILRENGIQFYELTGIEDKFLRLALFDYEELKRVYPQ